MESKPVLKTSKDITPQKKEGIPLSSVKFANTWVFWENYSSKTVKLKYEETNKEIFKWSDIITFFQFWNKYPGNNPKNVFYDGKTIKYYFKDKFRIISMNIFKEGIKPLWEDENNNGGKFLQMEYQVSNTSKMNQFCKELQIQWKKLALLTMGGRFPGSEYINGIRFIDKTNFDRGNKILFRIEIWISKKIKDKTLKELLDVIKKNFNAEKISVKDIKL